jgi:hypothetical protein
MAAAGEICYFVGSVGSTSSMCKSVGRSLCSVERVNGRLRAAAVKLGMLVMVNDEESDDSISRSATLGVKESQMSGLDEAEVRKIQKAGARRLFGLVGMEDDDQIMSEMQLCRALMDLGTCWVAHTAQQCSESKHGLVV